jgi:hypothetical protein
MAQAVHVRWGWLKGMYIYTLISAGGLGLGITLMPDAVRSAFGWPGQDPIVFGILGSVYLSFAISSVLGLRSPLKFAPVLFLSLCYKAVWFIGVIPPLLLAGKFPAYALLYVAVFASYVIGFLIAIPFPYLFAAQPETAWASVHPAKR